MKNKTLKDIGGYLLGVIFICMYITVVKGGQFCRRIKQAFVELW